MVRRALRVRSLHYPPLRFGGFGGEAAVSPAAQGRRLDLEHEVGTGASFYRSARAPSELESTLYMCSTSHGSKGVGVVMGRRRKKNFVSELVLLLLSKSYVHCEQGGGKAFFKQHYSREI